MNYGDGQSQSYSFDTLGNRSSKTDTVGGSSTSETYVYGKLNELTGRSVGGNASTYTNDVLGNTLTGGGRTNTWDSRNRLVSCVNGSGAGQKSNEFIYGSDGLRRRMTTTNSDGSQARTTYVLDGDKVVAETIQQRSSSSAVWSTRTTVSYLMGPSGPLYRKDSSNSSNSSNSSDVRWYVYDGLGSVVGEVNVNGAVTSAKKHDVYGLTRAVTGTPTSKHGFVGGLGHSSEDETGYIYMRARYYDPQIGRFISQDPARDGSNWISYCNGDPVNAVDANGKLPSTLEGAYYAAGAYLSVAIMAIEFFFFLKYGDVRGIIYGTMAVGFGAYLLADAMQEYGTGSAGTNGLVGSAIGVGINLVFEHLTKPETFVSKYMGAVGNVVAGQIAY